MDAAGAVPPWVTKVTVIAVSVVAAVAAVASYVHIASLAGEAGEGLRAYLLPFSVDGLLTASSMVLLVRRRRGESAGLLPWLGLLLGLAASLGANLASVGAHPAETGGEPIQPDLIDYLVSAWPPLALAVSFELLIMVTKSGADEEPAAPLPRQQAVADMVDGVDLENPRAPQQPRARAKAAEPRRRVAGRPTASATSDMGEARSRRAEGLQFARANWPVSGGEIAKHIGASRSEGDRIRGWVRDEKAKEAVS